MKNTLKGILEAFQGANGDEKLLLEEMNKLAHHFFFGGYFQINNRKIYLRDIEFYYHEEGDGAKIKDYIMYHISDKIKDPTMKNEYYPLGSFNAHVSGVDFTFENEDKKYRASILIRGIKVIDKDSEPIIETRPTYVYEYLLMGNSLFDDGIHIKWIDKELPIEPIEQGYRKNVCQYDSFGNKIEYQGDANNKPVTIGKKSTVNVHVSGGFGLNRLGDNI
ncbi:hypothetical protein NXX71_12375 [Bacteroides faecis]|nr:hypothetical protein [Bacteroides faecis]